MYYNVISLGNNCHVAWDLERMGYRCNSYPFDWVITNFCDVISLIDKHFVGNLKLEMIKQDVEAKNCFHDLGTGIDYYHDFFPDAGTVEEQYEGVVTKYNRRIQRFLETGKQKTLYVRVIRNQEDYQWTVENKEMIDNVIHRLNKESNVLYIAIGSEMNWKMCDALKLFISDDLYHPILACTEGKHIITKNVKISLGKIMKNKYHYYCKQIKKLIHRTREG